LRVDRGRRLVRITPIQKRVVGSHVEQGKERRGPARPPPRVACARGPTPAPYRAPAAAVGEGHPQIQSITRSFLRAQASHNTKATRAKHGRNFPHAPRVALAHASLLVGRVSPQGVGSREARFSSAWATLAACNQRWHAPVWPGRSVWFTCTQVGASGQLLSRLRSRDSAPGAGLSFLHGSDGASVAAMRASRAGCPSARVRQRK
jgi:hypothetical protein